MKVAEIKEVAERRPFRPFSIRLNNGARYSFREPRNFGAPQDYHVVVYFGDSECVPIDADSIVELMP